MNDRLSDGEVEYEQFMDFVNESDAQSAYEVFERTPALIRYMRVMELQQAYDVIFSGLGRKQAGYFVLSFVREVHDELSNLSVINLLTGIAESENLERMLNNIGPQVRKALEDLDKDRRRDHRKD